MTAENVKAAFDSLATEYIAKIERGDILAFGSVSYENGAFEECDAYDKGIETVYAEICIKYDSAEEPYIIGCAFDVDKSGEVSEEQYSEQMAELKEELDKFTRELDISADPAEYIKSERKRQEKEAAEMMEKFEEQMKKTNKAIICFAIGAFIIMLAAILVSTLVL